ncbi:MAG TPA: STAS domain-containing protein [Candidatus Dormibacteraeota bacterium]|nr:STAS domain-containing protein [Candidatus Dormibacteraeota bacterium]
MDTAAESITVTALPRVVDGLTAARLKKTFRNHVDGGRFLHIVDLLQVELLDSTGLGALIAALRSVREVGGTVRLVATNPQILKILHLTALDKVFSIHSSIDEARERFAQSTARNSA